MSVRCIIYLKKNRQYSVSAWYYLILVKLNHLLLKVPDFALNIFRSDILQLPLCSVTQQTQSLLKIKRFKTFIYNLIAARDHYS